MVAGFRVMLWENIYLVIPQASSVALKFFFLTISNSIKKAITWSNKIKQWMFHCWAGSLITNNLISQLYLFFFKTCSLFSLGARIINGFFGRLHWFLPRLIKTLTLSSFSMDGDRYLILTTGLRHFHRISKDLPR